MFDCLLYPLENCIHPVPYKLCWHSRDFLPGIPILEQISDCMAESRKIIFVFSENFMDSDFCRVELQLALARCQTSATRCIIPIALSEKNVPSGVKERITYLSAIVAGGETLTANVARILGK